MKTIKTTILIAFLLLGFAAQSQQLLIDRGIQVAGLWCFPLHGQEETYLYLPPRARLALDPDSLPQFSFMRYVMEKANTNASKTISEAAGGGILHFLVLYDTPKEQVARAQAALQQRLENNDKIKIRGPIVFESGRYAMVSSILNPENGKEEKKLIGVGEAPVLENSRIALTFDLDPTQAKLLLESFKMATPDVSLVFEMSFSGLTDEYEAEVEVNWDEVYDSHDFSAGGSVYFVSADVELGFSNLRKNNAIKLKTVGSNTNLESLVNTVYSKLVDLLFTKVEPTSVPAAERGGLNDAMAALIGPKGLLGSRNTTGFGVHVAYQLKMHRSSGIGKLNFNGRSTVSRKHYIAFNAGNLYKEYKDNPQIFRDVALDDAAFQQREIFVGIDGNLQREFEKMISSVTVRLRKKHETGATTTKELLINRKVFTDSLGKLSLRYLNNGDKDRLKWLNYEFQTVWQFTGGGAFTTDWQSESAAMVNLYVPFQRKRIELDGDLKSLSEKGIRAVSVEIKYPFFNQEKNARSTVRPGDNLGEKGFEITLPVSQSEVDYSITWFKADGTLNHTGKDQYGLIFIDELPEKN